MFRARAIVRSKTRLGFEPRLNFPHLNISSIPWRPFFRHALFISVLSPVVTLSAESRRSSSSAFKEDDATTKRRTDYGYYKDPTRQSAQREARITQFNEKILRACRVGDIQRAADLIRNMLNNGFNPTKRHFELLIETFDSTFPKIEQYVDQAIELSQRSDITLGQKNLQFLSAVLEKAEGDVSESAKRLSQLYLDSAEDPSYHETFYSKLLNACAGAGNLDNFTHIITNFRNMGGQPSSTFFYNMCLKCQANSKDNPPIDSKGFIESMENDGVKPDIITFNTLLKIQQNRRDGTGADTTVELMREAGIKLDSYSYFSWILSKAAPNRFSEPNQFGDALNIFEDMKKNGVEVNGQVMCSLAMAFRFGSKKWDGESPVPLLLEEIEKCGAAQSQPHIFHGILYGAIARSDWEDAFVVMKHMVSLNIKPDSKHFTDMIRRCIIDRKWEDFQKLLEMMIESQVAASPELVYLVLKGSLRERNVAAAVKLYDFVEEWDAGKPQLQYKRRLSKFAELSEKYSPATTYVNSGSATTVNSHRTRQANLLDSTQAVDLFSMMDFSEAKLGAVHLQLILKALQRSNDWSGIVRTSKKMVARGLLPTKAQYQSWLNACNKRASTLTLLTLFNEFSAVYTPDAHDYHRILGRFNKSMDIMSAIDLLTSMLEDRHTIDKRILEPTLNKMLKAHKNTVFRREHLQIVHHFVKSLLASDVADIDGVLSVANLLARRYTSRKKSHPQLHELLEHVFHFVTKNQDLASNQKFLSICEIHCNSDPDLVLAQPDDRDIRWKIIDKLNQLGIDLNDDLLCSLLVLNLSVNRLEDQVRLLLRFELPNRCPLPNFSSICELCAAEKSSEHAYTLSNLLRLYDQDDPRVIDNFVVLIKACTRSTKDMFHVMLMLRRSHKTLSPEICGRVIDAIHELPDPDSRETLAKEFVRLFGGSQLSSIPATMLLKIFLESPVGVDLESVQVLFQQKHPKDSELNFCKSTLPNGLFSLFQEALKKVGVEYFIDQTNQLRISESVNVHENKLGG